MEADTDRSKENSASIATDIDLASTKQFNPTSDFGDSDPKVAPNSAKGSMATEEREANLVWEFVTSAAAFEGADEDAGGGTGGFGVGGSDDKNGRASDSVSCSFTASEKKRLPVVVTASKDFGCKIGGFSGGVFLGCLVTVLASLLCLASNV